MDKKAFIKSVRSWDSTAVENFLRREPELAKYSDKIGKTALHHCAEINVRELHRKSIDSIKTARALIAAGADLNAIRIIIDDGEEFLATPLWYAVAWGKNFDLARFMLEHGARSDDNATGSAIWDQDLRMAELLRAHGGNVDQEFRGETPLLRTVRARRLRLLKWLIDNGAHINFQDPHGYSALHYAARGNHTLAQVRDLLSYGAKPDLKAKDGNTPISLAAARKKPKLMRLLNSF